ncbi:MAG: phosphoribosylformylglycinamidine cyclo-ligase [Planctomycetota bacterium]|jgi:phosphoribosylformylglycinamidine cyclo-ligase
MSKFINYEQSGVNINAGEEMVHRIYSAVTGTFGPRVIESKNSFAGMFRLEYDERLFKRNYKNPVLLACADGVGSKVQLAAKVKRFNTVGIDLVAMNVNDMLVHGAEPLFFLDYIAVHKLDVEMVAQLVEGIAAGCLQSDCALIGGETAEMFDTYRKADFDMAGFAVGVAERRKIITGKNITCGDVILGLASSGLHSNGYTLVRNICFKKHGLKMTDKLKELDAVALGEVLLEPTRIYVRPVVRLLSQYKVKKIVHGMAHITGGGLIGNIPRILPNSCDAVIRKSSWDRQKIFSFLQARGPVEEAEMFRVFNMGIGFVLIVAEDFANSIQKKLAHYGESVYRIGRITNGTGKVILKD